MAGYTTNKKTNHEIEKDTGYVRAGQGGKRHRFGGKLSAAPKDKMDVDPKGSSALDGLGDLGGMSGMSGVDSDGDPNMDMMGGEGPLDHDINAAPEPHAIPGHSPAIHPTHNVAPVAVHIHLSPSDHKAFKGMAGKKPGKNKY